MGSGLDTNITLSPCLKGRESPLCGLPSPQPNLAHPDASIVVDQPWQMQPLYSATSWSNYWASQFGSDAWGLARTVFMVLDRHDQFPNDGFLDVASLDFEKVEDDLDSLHADSVQSDRIKTMLEKTGVYQRRYLNEYTAVHMAGKTVAINHEGEVSTFRSDALDRIWERLDGQSMARIVMDRRTIKETVDDPLNPDRKGTLGIRMIQTDPRVTGGLGVFPENGRIEQMPFETNLAGFMPEDVDGLVMVASAAIMALAVFSGKRGSGGPSPVLAVNGEAPLTRQPLTMQVPGHVLQQLGEAMSKPNKIPTVYLAEGGGLEPQYDLAYTYRVDYQKQLLRGVDVTPRPWNIYDIIMARLPTDAVIADVGCGTAVKSLPLATHIRELIGIESNGEMIEAARANAQRQRATNVRFVTGSYDQLPIPDASVDMVVGFLAPHLVSEIHRVLKPDGWAIVERVGDRDKVNIKSFFSGDYEGPRGQLMNVESGSRAVLMEKEFRELFQHVEIRNGFWETEYTYQELVALLENTPTIRNFSAEKDAESIRSLWEALSDSHKIRTSQNRVLAIARK